MYVQQLGAYATQHIVLHCITLHNIYLLQRRFVLGGNVPSVCDRLIVGRSIGSDEYTVSSQLMKVAARLLIDTALRVVYPTRL